jgi:hypothetical protein
MTAPWWQTFRCSRRCAIGWGNSRLLCCGSRRTGKAMGQVYQCGWRIYREINVFPGSNITCFTFYIHVWPIYWPFLMHAYTEWDYNHWSQCSKSRRQQLHTLQSTWSIWSARLQQCRCRQDDGKSYYSELREGMRWKRPVRLKMETACSSETLLLTSP